MLIKFFSFLFFFISFIFANSIQIFETHTSSLYSCVSVRNYSHPDQFLVDSGSYDLYYNNVYYTCSLIKKYTLNFDCLNSFNSPVSLQYTDSDIYPNTEGDTIYINPTNLDYCSNCPTFSTISRLCYDKNNSPICQSGYVFSSTDEKCIFDCSDKNMETLGAKKCGGKNYIKSYTCSQDGNYSITCYTCLEIMNLAQEYCKQNGYTLKDGLTCSAENGKITTNLNFPDFNLSICNIPDNNNTDINGSANYHSNDTNNSTLLTDTNTSNNTTLINSLNALKNQLHNDNKDIANNLNQGFTQLHNDNKNVINSLNALKAQLHNDNKDIKANLVGINNTNTQGFARLHSDLQGINKKLNELNNSISILGNLKQIINNTSWLDNVRTDLTQGINKYKNYNFVTSDASTSDICLKDVSFTLYGKTITLKVSQIANSIYVKVVKAVLWLSASLLIFFTCFRTD